MFQQQASQNVDKCRRRDIRVEILQAVVKERERGFHHRNLAWVWTVIGYHLFKNRPMTHQGLMTNVGLDLQKDSFSLKLRILISSVILTFMKSFANLVLRSTNVEDGEGSSNFENLTRNRTHNLV
jgi:hypothetical protein